MKTLVVGASGTTGKHLVEQLLKAGQTLKVIVRSTFNTPPHWIENENITIIKANISEISSDEMIKQLSDCSAIASCLGHNITLKGIFGKPRKLVTDSVSMICDAIIKCNAEKPIKFVLMNTVAIRNKDLGEQISFIQKVMMGLIRILLPPQKDNEMAAEYLRLNFGMNNPYIEWTVIRPDSLTNEDKVTEYTLHASPTRSGLLNPGKTSRINVGNFMARLITEEELWNTWKGKMPVIYNM